MSEDIAIKIYDLSKSFKLPHEKHSSIKSAVFSSLKGVKRTYEKQEVLKNISFEVKKGEFFGVVGRNGSGKSTLLKLLAGVYSPDKGHIQINGKLTPFIELGVGFNPELTGRENVYLNGALLGFSRKEMDRMYEEIVEFAELEKFMDQSLKNYSSGMQVRLAFSIAIRARSDILILDEVLAVGDEAFQKKCLEYFEKLKKENITVVLVTHDMSIVRRFCNRCLLIDNNKIIDIGDPDKISKYYEKLNNKAFEEYLLKKNNETKKTLKYADILRVETFDPKTMKVKDVFLPDESISVRVIYKGLATIKNPSLSFIIQDFTEKTVFATNNHITKNKLEMIDKNQEVIYETEIDNVFTNDTYTITAAIENNDFTIMYDIEYFIHKFKVEGHVLPHAITHPKHKSSIEIK